MSYPVEIDLVLQPTQSTDLALEDLLGELGGNQSRSASGQARIEDARGNTSPSPDSFQVLPRDESLNSGTSRNFGNTQMLQDRDMLSIMEEISENPVRGSDPGSREATGRNAGAEMRTAVGAEVGLTGS